jgi:hypothetical protein
MHERNLDSLGFSEGRQGVPQPLPGPGGAPFAGMLPQASPLPAGLDVHGMMFMQQQQQQQQQQQALLAHQAFQGFLPPQQQQQQQHHPPPQQPQPQQHRGGQADLHRLKICGVPTGTFTDAKLRQLFELCGKVRGDGGDTCASTPPGQWMPPCGPAPQPLASRLYRATPPHAPRAPEPPWQLGLLRWAPIAAARD